MPSKKAQGCTFPVLLPYVFIFMGKGLKHTDLNQPIPALRLSYGVAQRLPRVSPTAPIRYGNWTIPAGVPFSMSTYLMHHDESIFPNSHTFDPSRWLHNPKVSGNKPLSRYLVSFSKGPRMCLGLHLAWAELYIGLANVIRRLDFELFDTGHEAVVMASEFVVPRPKEGTKGVRVLVK